MNVHWFLLFLLLFVSTAVVPAAVVPGALSSIVVNLFTTVVHSFPLSLAGVLPAAVLSIVVVDCCSQSPIEKFAILEQQRQSRRLVLFF